MEARLPSQDDPEVSTAVRHLYTDAERAALALAEAATRLQDGAPGVTDEVWAAAAEHFDEKQLGALTLEIALTNFFNRINHTLREQAGKTW